MTALMAKAQIPVTDEIQLVADNVEIPIGQQYRMYVKQYSQKIYDYLSQNPRIAIDFEAADPTIVEAAQYFKGLKEGTTTVKLVVYSAINSYGDPDWSNKLDETSFTVTVKDKVAAAIPTINTSWGMSREEMTNIIVNNYGYERYTDTYFDMNPVAAADPSSSMFEMYYTGLFEFPVVYNVFNDEDQMIAYQFVISNYERAWNITNMEDAPIVKILTANGYTLYGQDEAGRPALYNPTTYTLVTFDNFILQGLYYLFCTFEYEPENQLDPQGIATADLKARSVEINSRGTMIDIEADGHEGETVEIYSLDGKMLGKTTIKNGKAQVNLSDKTTVIVKVGKNCPMKMNM